MKGQQGQARTDAGGLLEAAAAHAEVLCALVDTDSRPRACAGVAINDADAEIGAIVASGRHWRVAQTTAVLHERSQSLASDWQPR